MPEEPEQPPAMKADEILLIKLIPPRPHSSLILRPDLFARLDDGLEKSITLITAPTGFGKTTLVSQWLETRRELAQAGTAGGGTLPAIQAWVTLDAGDNDPVRFWRYGISAIQHSQPEIGRKALAFLRAAPIPSYERLLTSLLNDLAQTARPVFLTLDDFHHIMAPEVIETIQFLVENLPPNVRLFLLARTEPRLNLALLRARGEINQLRADDLRFSEVETGSLLQRVLPFPPSPDLVNRLLDKTEGWAAGIRLVTQVMRGQAQAAGREDDAGLLIESFRGEHRYVLEYLRREVFDKLPEPARDFILRTCFLARLSGPLCDWVLQDADSPLPPGTSAELLARLEQDSLFLTELGASSGSTWYRYQSLFAEAMRHEARQILGEARVRSIHKKACQWYEQHGLLEEAVDAALAAGEQNLSLKIIERYIAERSFNEILLLRRWCEQIPVERIRQHPQVAFTFAQALLFSSDRYAQATATRVLPLLLAAEETWRAQQNPAGVGQALTLQGIMAWWQGDLQTCFRYAHEALGFLSESDVLWRGVALLALGNEAFLDGSLSVARNYLLEAQALSGAANNIHSALAARNQLGDIAFQEGLFEQAGLHYQQVLALAVGGEEMLDDQSVAWLGLARIAYEQNDLRTAEQQARRALELSTQRANEVVWVPATLLLAQTAHQQGQGAHACSDLEAILPRVRQGFALREVWSTIACLLISTGDLVSARSWYNRIANQPERLFAAQQASEWLLQARLAIAAGQPNQALARLKSVQAEAKSQGRVRNEIEALTLQSQAYDAQGERARAVQALTVALTLGQPKDFRRIFLDEGRPLERMLPEIAAGQAARSTGLYATALIHAFSQTGSQPMTGTPTRRRAGFHVHAPPHAMLVEPLSSQELRVLRLLVAGHSNPEIAEDLTVSVNTIKTQVQSIFRKLNVNSRREAQDAARAFNLI